MSKVTLVMTTFNSNPKLFRRTLDSIEKQTHKNMEIIVVDDGSTKKKHYTEFKTIPGIKYMYLEKNVGIAECTTRGIELATGEYIGFIDHDDLLKPTCIADTVAFLKNNPQYSMVYTDEEFIDDQDEVIRTTCKEDYNEELLLSKMYLNHFKLIRSEVCKEFLPLRYSGAQDYDLVLKISEKYSIGHLRKILYSWRQSKQSLTTNGITEDVYQNSKRAIEDAITRRKIDARVIPSIIKTHWHVDRKINTREPVSIIILTKDQPQHLKNCLKGLEQNTDYPYEVIIVDTGTTDPDALEILHTTYHRVIRDKFHFSKNNNAAVKLAHFKYILFLNNDTIPLKGWLSEMVKHIQRSDVGIVGSRLLYSDSTIQHAGVALGIGGIAGHLHLQKPTNHPAACYIREVSSVTGACLMIKKDIFEQVNGFDPEYIIEFQDVDLCMKVRKLGYKVIYNPYSTLYHTCSATRGTPSKEIQLHDRPLFVGKWHEELRKQDPNLTESMLDPNHIPTMEYYLSIAKSGVK